MGIFSSIPSSFSGLVDVLPWSSFFSEGSGVSGWPNKVPEGGEGAPGAPGNGLSVHYPLHNLPSLVFLIPFTIP
jgi:hypothetical protein